VLFDKDDGAMGVSAQDNLVAYELDRDALVRTFEKTDEGHGFSPIRLREMSNPVITDLPRSVYLMGFGLCRICIKTRHRLAYRVYGSNAFAGLSSWFSQRTFVWQTWHRSCICQGRSGDW